MRAGAGRRVALAVVALWAAPFPAAATQEIIDVRAGRAPVGNSFEALWSAYLKAAAHGDQDGQRAAYQEIRRYRIERNIRSLEPIALARLGEGLIRLEKGDIERAEEDFRAAITLDPHLPDAYFGLAQRQMKKGPLGILPAIRDTFSGLIGRASCRERVFRVV